MPARTSDRLPHSHTYYIYIIYPSPYRSRLPIRISNFISFALPSTHASEAMNKSVRCMYRVPITRISFAKVKMIKFCRSLLFVGNNFRLISQTVLLRTGLYVYIYIYTFTHRKIQSYFTIIINIVLPLNHKIIVSWIGCFNKIKCFFNLSKRWSGSLWSNYFFHNLLV